MIVLERLDVIKSTLLPPLSAKCGCHGFCRLADVAGDISGSPCQPWSRFGKRLGWADVRSLPVLIWLARILCTLPHFAIHENVCGFDAEFMRNALSEHYYVYLIKSSTRDFGWGIIRRVRLFRVAVRKTGTRLLADVSERYRALCSSVAPQLPALRISDIFSATELLVVENQKRSKRQLPHIRSPNSDCEYLLTPTQTLYLESNIELWKAKKHRDSALDPECVFDLSQNPACRMCTSASGALPTLRHSGSLLWSPYHRRWILAIELAAASGFAVRSSQSDAALMSQDIITAAHASVRDLGNGIHVGQVGMVLCACLTSFTKAR